MQSLNDEANPPPIADDEPLATTHRKNLLKLIHGFSGRHHHWQVFSDFVECAAVSISNAVDATHREERETRYMEVIRRYSSEEANEFPKMLAELTLALEAAPLDALGLVLRDSHAVDVGHSEGKLGGCVTIFGSLGVPAQTFSLIFRNARS